MLTGFLVAVIAVGIFFALTGGGGQMAVQSSGADSAVNKESVNKLSVLEQYLDRYYYKSSEITKEDKETGISRYEAMIDGEWALLGRPNSANNNLVLVLDPEHVTKGKRHELAVTVTDGCGNQTTEHFVFTW